MPNRDGDDFRAGEDAPFPVIAAANEPCPTAGLELAFACEFIYAADDTIFSQVEALAGATTRSLAGFIVLPSGAGLQLRAKSFTQPVTTAPSSSPAGTS
ncbi:enoyl-CoA hydratase-related protein [Streptomyces sp. NBC_01485]|uniref:enoyl-CoA hydratase-related protein n=1 Tax=Streptomyces sp. NBC_01485 TaxID=2903884 RepID=UPI003FCD68D2